MIQPVALLTMNYTLICIVILQSGRMLSPYLEYKLRVDPSGFFDTQVNFNQFPWCHILPSVIFRLHIQRGTKRIMFSFEYEGLYSLYCSGNFAGILVVLEAYTGTAVAQWLRYCATNRKVAVSIPAGVTGFFIDIKPFRSH